MILAADAKFLAKYMSLELLKIFLKSHVWISWQTFSATCEQVNTYRMAFLVFRIVKCLGISIIRLIISIRLNGMNYLFELMKQARYEGIIIFSIKTFLILLIKRCHRWIRVEKDKLFCRAKLQILQILFLEDKSFTSDPSFMSN